VGILSPPVTVKKKRSLRCVLHLFSPLTEVVVGDLFFGCWGVCSSYGILFMVELLLEIWGSLLCFAGHGDPGPWWRREAGGRHCSIVGAAAHIHHVGGHAMAHGWPPRLQLSGRTAAPSRCQRVDARGGRATRSLPLSATSWAAVQLPRRGRLRGPIWWVHPAEPAMEEINRGRGSAGLRKGSRANVRRGLGRRRTHHSH
jgi:hypothetical protein